MSTVKKKRPFGGPYPQYDTSNGFGNAKEWQSSFDQRTGSNRAKSVIGEEDPFEILGVDRSADIKSIRFAWRSKVRATHPDLNPGIDIKKFHRVQSAYEVLMDLLDS